MQRVWVQSLVKELGPACLQRGPHNFFLSVKNLVSGVAWVQLNCVWLQRSFCFHYTILSNFGSIGGSMMP